MCSGDFGKRRGFRGLNRLGGYAAAGTLGMPFWTRPAHIMQFRPVIVAQTGKCP